MREVLTTILICLISLCFIGCKKESTVQTTTEENPADEYIRQLSSENESERIIAKKKLIQLAEPAAKRLIAWLEGYPIIEVDKFVKPSVKNDVYEILGAIHSEEAIPILVKTMEREVPAGMEVGLSPVMQALVEIGSPAVPHLITSIEAAEKMIAASDSSKPLKELNRIIQIRASLVLAEIGDKRALPVLQHLEQSVENDFMRNQIARAIEQISHSEDNSGNGRVGYDK
ncbi:MAG: hypothetical protein AB1757_01240 [Acidobacteriota bacterium]